MRIIYIRNTPEFPTSFPYYWKVIQVSEEVTEVLTVREDAIETETVEDFFDQVNFIKNTLCKDSDFEEIERQQFDDFYKTTVEKINKLSAY